MTLFPTAREKDPSACVAVYVDSLRNCLRSARWRWSESCHLFVDHDTDMEVLHAFARRIGLRREWFQYSRRGLPHYDLNSTRRVQAVNHGAIELDTYSTGMVIRRWRVKEVIA